VAPDSESVRLDLPQNWCGEKLQSALSLVSFVAFASLLKNPTHSRTHSKN
jgi:hypothetical protein